MLTGVEIPEPEEPDFMVGPAVRRSEPGGFTYYDLQPGTFYEILDQFVALERFIDRPLVLLTNEFSGFDSVREFEQDDADVAFVVNDVSGTIIMPYQMGAEAFEQVGDDGRRLGAHHDAMGRGRRGGRMNAKGFPLSAAVQKAGDDIAAILKADADEHRLGQARELMREAGFTPDEHDVGRRPIGASRSPARYETLRRPGRPSPTGRDGGNSSTSTTRIETSARSTSSRCSNGSSPARWCS